MKAISILCLCVSSAASVFGVPTKEAAKEVAKEASSVTDCEVVKSVKFSFYSREDTRDPIAYPECGRTIAGGKGTYESPLTMGTAPGEFAKCEIVYVPYLLKYVRFEDICTECVKNYAKGKLHMQIWLGNSMAGGQEQTQCVRDFTPAYAMPIVRYPGRGQLSDIVSLYQWGARDPCRLDHRYKVINVNAFCYDKEDESTDHIQDQRNSVSSLGHPYMRPYDEGEYRSEEEETQSPQYEEPAQDQEVFYDQSDAAWGLHQGI